jgi:tRNA-splicing ligase RtcB
MRVVKDDSMRVPVKLWLEEIEDGAMQQALDLSRLRFAFHHIAIMPDSHVGYGMPIGGILATDGVVVPNAVGVDIGCGMRSARFDLPADIGADDLKRIMGEIRKRVPLGFEHHKEKQEWEGFDAAPDILVIQRELSAAHFQLGTLGGGNHFIEIQRGSDGHVWVTLHSGSRNFGLKIAKEYHDKARMLCERWYSDIPNPDLSFLPMENGGGEYWEAMKYALAFARENRSRMMHAIDAAVIAAGLPGYVGDMLDIHHNYAAMEHHFGKNVMVHRKGAVKAYEDDQGIIPGSQGTASYIVRGLGNPESFKSSSHGAGRKLGRAAAQRTLSLEDEKRRLDERGIIHAIRNVKDLDEAAGAYKDIDAVMANQADLVQVVVKLEPLAVIKA